MTIRSLVEGSRLPRHEAERLLMAVTGLERAGVVGLEAVSDADRDRFEAMVARRRQGEPLQYLEEVVPFGSIAVRVDERVLIPRPETEHLWELASRRVEPSIVVDLCTGSGVLALSAKHRWSNAAVYGTDISVDALAVADDNAHRLQLEVEWREGDLFDALEPDVRGSIDLVLANPPYVAESEFEVLPDDVRLHEPRQALVADDEGLAVLRRLGAEVADWMAPGGEVWCEIGETQGAAARAAFTELDAQVVQDLTGRDRYIHGVKR